MDVASCADRYLDITFGLQLVENSSLFSVHFKEVFNHPFSFTSKCFFCYLFLYFFRRPITFF